MFVLKKEIFSLISYFYWLSAQAPSPTKVGILGYPFLSSLCTLLLNLHQGRRVTDLIFRASHFTHWHDCQFGHFIPFCLPLWSRGIVLTNEVGWMTHFRPSLQAGLFSTQQSRKGSNLNSDLCLAFSPVFPVILAFRVTEYLCSINLETLYMFSSERYLKGHLFRPNGGHEYVSCNCEEQM